MDKGKVKKPADVTFSKTSVAENAAAGSVVATLGATDAKGKAVAATYALGGDDAGLFQIVGNQIVLKSGVTLDHETAANLDLTVTATNKKGSFTEAVTISVTDVNEAPTDMTLLGGSISEAAVAGTVAAVLVGSDPENDAITYSIVGGTGATKFGISGSQVVLATGASLNYDVASSYTLVVRAADAAGNTYDETLNIGVTDSALNNTFALTENLDNVVGNASDNTIDGSLKTTTAGRLQTWNNADQIDGGDGVDTMFAVLTANVTAAKFNKVEVLEIENQNNGTVVDLNTGDSKLTTLKVSNAGANDLTVQNVQSAIANYEVTNNSAGATALTVTVANTALAGTADAATVKLSNVSTASVALGTVTAASGYETINIESNGSVKNGVTADLVLDDGLGNSLTTVNFSGAQALDIDFTPTTVTTVNAATMTGALDVQFAATNAQNVTVTGGKGNDIIDVQGFNANDTVNGGDGTDRLVLTNAEAIAATTARTNVTNVEWLRLSDTTNGTGITVGNVAVGATGLQLAGVSHTGNVLATFATGTANFDRQDSTDNGNETITLTINGVATNDVLNVTLGTAAAGSTWNGNGAFTINGAETVNINTLGGAATIGGALTVTNTAASEAIVVTGAQNLVITGAVTADSINASGMTGTAVLQMNGGSAAQSISITGTGNNDVLIGGTAADIINGGAGNDTIQNAVSGTNSAANDILSGGAGNDSYQLVGSSASAANYTGSAFINDFTVGTTATNGDLLVLDITAATYGASDLVEAPSTSLTATAAGASTTLIQSVAQNAAAAAGVTGVDLIKLTTGVAFNTDLQTTFNSAIGTASVTGYTAADDVFVMFYDTTNARAVLAVADVGGADTTLGTGDTVRLVGTINMTATDFAAFNSNNLAFVDF